MKSSSQGNKQGSAAAWMYWWTLCKWQASPVGQGKEPACNAGGAGDMSLTPGSGRSPAGGNGNPLQHWRTPGTEEPGGLPSMGSHRVGHDWSDLVAAAFTEHFSITTTTHITWEASPLLLIDMPHLHWILAPCFLANVQGKKEKITTRYVRGPQWWRTPSFIEHHSVWGPCT